jgi:hypothetical protein
MTGAGEGNWLAQRIKISAVLLRKSAPVSMTVIRIIGILGFAQGHGHGGSLLRNSRSV